MHEERNNKMMETVDSTILVLWIVVQILFLGIPLIFKYKALLNDLEEARLSLTSTDETPVPAYRPIVPKRKHCSLCKNGENSIQYISGLTMRSPYSVYDLGGLDDIKYCPCCGRKLKKAESKIIPKSNK